MARTQKVKEFSPTAWEASHGGVTVSFSVEGDSLSVVYTLKGGANGICQVTAYTAASASAGPALPVADEKACLKAVRRQTNNNALRIAGDQHFGGQQHCHHRRRTTKGALAVPCQEW